MLKTYVTAFIASIAPAALLLGNPINPQSPIPITTTNNVTSSTVTAGSNSGFLAVWRNSSDDLTTSFSTNDGSSWSSTTTVSGNAVLDPSVCYGSLGFVIGWPSSSLIGGGPFPWVSFSNNNGSSWTNSVLANDGVGGNTVSVCANQSGFLAVYTSSLSGKGLASFSSDGLSWSTPSDSQINTVIDSVDRSIAATATGMGNTFASAWVDTSDNAQTSTTTVTGGALNSWSSSVALTSDGSVRSQVTLATNGSVFMAAWVNSSGVAYSAYSATGSSWSTPSQIATGLNTAETVNVGLTGDSNGFVAAWQDSSNVFYASFSSDNGISWTPKVKIASGLEPISSSTAGVSLVSAECLFTWTSNTSNAFSNGSAVPPSPANIPRAFKRPNNGR